FMGAAIALAVVAVILAHRSRLVVALLALLPLFVIGQLLAYRRVGFIALGVMFIAIAIVAMFNRPRRALALMAIIAIRFGSYLIMFSDVTGPLGEPLRAMRSVLDASSTSLVDQASSAWRDVEH